MSTTVNKRKIAQQVAQQTGQPPKHQKIRPLRNSLAANKKKSPTTTGHVTGFSKT